MLSSKRLINISIGLNSIRCYSAIAGNRDLRDVDPDLWNIMQKEKSRQAHGLELIASENFTSKAVMQALGSCFTNKYSEGYPSLRYYGGNQYIDAMERLCQARALDAYKLNPDEWGVNVQPLSGSPANFAAYTAVLQPHDRLMGLALAHGGHLTHGFYSPVKKISATSIYFESLPYELDLKTELIDYDTLEKNAVLFRPKIIVAGASAYSRDIDYARMKKICQKVGAYLMSDMAHISGLVLAGVTQTNPFDHSDIVTTTTHKSLRGPRGGLIFYRKGVRSTTKSGQSIMYDLEEKINFSVFPMLQGGPHNNQIAAVAVAFKEAMTPEFINYQKSVINNAKRLADCLTNHGIRLVTGGTSNHLMLADLKSKGIDGARVEKVLEAVHITVNKNAVPGDTSPFVPSGIRLGTPALTSRGLREADFEIVAQLIIRGIDLALDINCKNAEASKKLTTFSEVLCEREKSCSKIKAIADDVINFSKKFPMPASDVNKE